MIDSPYFPIAVGAGIAILVFADRRLKRAAQPLRLRLAQKGEDFLALRDIPDSTRSHVKFLLDRAFGMRASLLLALVAIPVIAVLFVVNQRSLLKSVQKLDTLDPAVRAEFFEIVRLHDRITLTNHYFLLPIVELELVLFMPLAIVLRGIIRGSVPETGGRDSVITFIEDKRIHGIHPFSHSHAVANNR
jgi:hypothetical protein